MVKESIPGQVDKKSRVPKEEKGSGALKAKIGVWNSQGEERTNFFFSPLYIP